MPQLQDGILLFESFESPTFITDQGWTVNKGVPARSQMVAKDGDWSFQLDTTEALISKNIGGSVGFQLKSSAVWFYDDATATAAGASSPFVFWEDTGANVYGLGVDMGTPGSGLYSEIHAGAGPNATAVARTTGWHRFEIQEIGVNYVLSIDGTVVSTSAVVHAIQIIRVGLPFTMAPSYQFGFFDVVQVYTDYVLQVSNLNIGQKVSLFNSAGTLIVAGTAAGASVKLDINAVDYPFTGYITITREDAKRPFYISPTQIFSQGDVWVFDVFDFGRRPTMMTPAPTAMRMDTKATSGKQQSVLFYDQDKIMLVFTDLTEDKKNEFLRFWGTINAGQVFGCAINSGATFYGLLNLSTYNFGGYTNEFSVASEAGMGPGDELLFRDQAGIHTMVGRLVSFLNANVGVLAQYFTQPFQVGDQVRHLYYWPFVQTLDTQANVSLADVRLRRWTVSLQLQEAI